MSCPSISYPHHVSGATTVGECNMSAPAAQCHNSHSVQLRTGFRSGQSIAMAACYSPYEILSPVSPPRTAQVPVQKEYSVAKDYSRPLHVDCSVEYELPNAAKPPLGIRNEPLLMIHPCYFRKIESQKRSPFVNNLPNLPTRASQTASVLAVKRRLVRSQQGQQLPQQVPQLASSYPASYAPQYTADTVSLWDNMPPMVPMTPAPSYCSKISSCAGAYSDRATYTERDTSNSLRNTIPSSHWTPDPSPDTLLDEKQHILTGKFRTYLKTHQHRLHPYMSSSIPLASTFPQIQQVCYNV